MARICPVCGEEITGRRDKIFCCDACRVNHYNKLHRNKRKKVYLCALRKFQRKMKKYFLTAALIAMATITSCNQDMKNPLLADSTAPHGAPAFDKIQFEDFEPAFAEALAEAKAEKDSIINNPEAPTFENTIDAMARCGEKLNKVSNIFFNLNHCCTSDQIDSLAEVITPQLTEFSMSIMLDPVLFQRVKAVYDSYSCGQPTSVRKLTQEEQKLLEETYKGFVRNGANLDDAQKAEFAKLEEQLSLSTLAFGKNALAATNAFTINISDEEELKGLPDFVKAAAAEEAAARDQKGWTFTLKAPSYRPFLQYSENRPLREKMWRAYNTQCIKGEHDNTALIGKIVGLRLKESQMLGYATYADYALEERMAKNPQTVNAFLADMQAKAYPFGTRDVQILQDFAATKGFTEKIMPWDISYWRDQYKNATFDLTDEMLKPYFELGSVQNAIFALANRLYGLTFKQNKRIPVYQEDVKAFEVFDKDGKFLALLYIDNFPRDNKRSGAWMTEFRGTSVDRDGKEQRPFIQLVTNFTKPTANEPSLITFDEFTTILHEFGHCLHGMLAKGTYESLTGTNVARDFVELPSQIMENWAYEPEYLQSFAKHYKTGEVIPQEYIDKILAAKTYMAGYDCLRQLNFGLVDMAWHSATSVPSVDPVEFERAIVEKAPILPTVPGTAFSYQFTHIFSGGYAAGYYSYKWAEVLEADAYSRFKENGIFDAATAQSFRDEILSRGSIEDADVLYRNFMGRDPQPEALFAKMGMK